MKTNTNIYDQITSQIMKQLENGIVPWQKPWQNGTFMGCVSHTNGKPYSLLNQWLLNGKAGEWLTYKQIQAEGGRVKAGEKASTVVFWKYVNKVEERTKTKTTTDASGNVVEIEDTFEVVTGKFPILKGYAVFHIDQTEGIKPKYENKANEYEHEAIEEAEVVIAGYVERDNLRLFVEDSDKAFYRPSTDEVHVPKMQQYKVCEEYYSTLFHELTHSTGHAKRLNRKEVAGVSFFGDENYSREELVAEIGAAFLCQTVGIKCEKAFNNSIAYLQGWLRALKNDKKLIVAAAAKAEAAVRYILNDK